MKGGLHSGVVVRTIISQQEGFWFEFWLGTFSMFSRVCVGSLRVLQLPHTTQKHAC